MSKNEQNFIVFCNELRAYVEEHHLFPDKHTRLSHKVKYTRKKINEGTLEEWKRVMFEEIAGMRDLSIHTGGRRKSSHDPCAGASLWDSLSVATGLKPSSTGSGQV